MVDHHILRFSDYAKQEIESILCNIESFECDDYADAVWQIESVCRHALYPENYGDRREMRKDMIKLSDALENVVQLKQTISFRSRQAFDDCIPYDTGEPIDVDKSLELAIPNFLGSSLPVSGAPLNNLFAVCELALEVTNIAIDELDTPRGARPNRVARTLALNLRMEFDDLGIPVSSYVDGPYMQVLSVAFTEYLPTEISEAFRRHGHWAVSVGDYFEGVDWATMREDEEIDT